MVRLGDGALCQFGEIAILHIELAALVHFRQKDEAFGELRHACDLLVDAFGPFALTVGYLYDLGVGVYDGERGLGLVACIGDEPPLLGVTFRCGLDRHARKARYQCVHKRKAHAADDAARCARGWSQGHGRDSVRLRRFGRHRRRCRDECSGVVRDIVGPHR